MIRKGDAIERNAILKHLSGIENIIKHEPVELANGEVSEYYVDIKMSTGYPGILREFANYIVSSLGLEINNFSCVIGSGYGGVPLATAVFLRLDLLWNMKLSMFRDSPKEHGKPSMFDGYLLKRLNRNKKLIIIDDVYTTGESIRKIVEALPKDLIVGKIFVICNRSGIKKPMINGIEVEYLFTAEELMEAIKNNF